MRKRVNTIFPVIIILFSTVFAGAVAPAPARQRGVDAPKGNRGLRKPCQRRETLATLSLLRPLNARSGCAYDRGAGSCPDGSPP